MNLKQLLAALFLLFAPMALAVLLSGCSPSYIPAPVVNLEEVPARAEKPPAPEEPPAPEVAPTPPAADEGRAAPPDRTGPRPEYYTVRSGDTLAGIALDFGMSHRDIALWNGISNPNVVRVGERLRLTPPPSHPVASAVGGGAGREALREASGVQVAKAPSLAEIPAAGGEAAAAAESGGGGIVGGGNAATALRPETTIAGGAEVVDGGGNPSGVVGEGGGALVKTGPLAEGFAYSAAKLRELRAAWDARQKAKDESQNTETALAKPADEIDSGGTGGTGGVVGPEAIRRAFGVEWSWPARGDLLSGFTDSSRGWDIGGESGDPIYAAADGKVIYAGSGIKGFGRLVIVKHNNDYLSAYAHNRRILMKEGAQVRRGDLIAEMGDSGAERTKLHFEIRKAGRPTDPAEFLPERP